MIIEEIVGAVNFKLVRKAVRVPEGDTTIPMPMVEDDIRKLAGELNKAIASLISSVPVGKSVKKVSINVLNVPDRINNPNEDRIFFRILGEAE